VLVLVGGGIGLVESGILNHASDSYSLTSTASGWTTDSSCSFKSDGYHDTSTEICFAPSNPVSNGSISVETTEATGSSSTAYGIVFRHASTGNYYVFYIGGSGQWGLDKVVGGSDSNLGGGANAAIKTGAGAVNSLKVTLSGSSYTFYVNGAQVGTATDSTFSQGDTGLVGADSADIVFTNFEITR
jgi:hypothetical protein